VQVLGNHEPNVILKDNDLKHKIRLPGSSARFLLKQLEKDTEILCSLGVMDYSLLGEFSSFPSFSWNSHLPQWGFTTRTTWSTTPSRTVLWDSVPQLIRWHRVGLRPRW
jgi:hypothetical protein